jgi:predicted nucleic acid-binding protein
VIIEALRGRIRTLDELHTLQRTGVTTYYCAVSWAEIFAGVRPGEELATEAFFELRADVAIDAHVGRRAGRYLARFARSHGLDVADALIAAVASMTRLRLWTLNRRHYPMDDVQFYEPADQQ